jgi:hypothetical protein
LVMVLMMFSIVTIVVQFQGYNCTPMLHHQLWNF